MCALSQLQHRSLLLYLELLALDIQLVPLALVLLFFQDREPEDALGHSAHLVLVKVLGSRLGGVNRFPGSGAHVQVLRFRAVS